MRFRRTMPTDTTDDQPIVEEIHGDLDRPAITVDDVYTELIRPEVGEK
jgi:hypothetical protein